MSDFTDIKNCKLCPRECGANRVSNVGACGAGAEMSIAKAYLHTFEEPPISGADGSGAVFFCGCNLRCGYCQNFEISHSTQKGKTISVDELCEIMLRLKARGAHNINLVTAAHYLPQVAIALEKAKKSLAIPVIYNSSGYEKVEALKLLDGLVDVYLPDFKYINPDTAQKYSLSYDYPEVAKAAISEMVRQTGKYTEIGGLVTRGTIVRHLVLPGQSRDGEEIMKYVAEHFPSARVSLMSQYTPSFNHTSDPALDRKITSLEYNRVVNAALRYGLEGFTQMRSSATDKYTPDF